MTTSLLTEAQLSTADVRRFLVNRPAGVCFFIGVPSDSYRG